MYESQNDYLRNTPDEWEPSDSILQKKICKMIEDTYPILRNFPKVERYAMTADIKRIMDSMVELTIDADNHRRKTALEKLDIANKKLKKYIRLAFRLQFIAPRNYKRSEQDHPESLIQCDQSTAGQGLYFRHLRLHPRAWTAGGDAPG